MGERRKKVKGRKTGSVNEIEREGGLWSELKGVDDKRKKESWVK